MTVKAAILSFVGARRAFLPQRFVVTSAALILGAMAGCVDGDPCDPGQTVSNGQCIPPSGSGGSTGGETDCYPGTNATKAEWAAEDAGGMTPDAVGGQGGDGGDGGSVSAGGAAGNDRVCANFGADCSTQEECVGGLFCGVDLGFPICSQGSCAEGEDNEGICPPGFTCFVLDGQSGCIP